jgi:ribose transport system permease protein
MSNAIKTTTQAATSAAPTNRFIEAARREIGQVLAVSGLAVICIFFSIMRPVFREWQNISNILLSTTVTGMLALGVTFVIITGGIDLSIGTSMTLCAVTIGKILVVYKGPLWLGVLGGIAVGAAVGAINGTLITALKLPPFIATLATMKAAQGLALIYSNLAPIHFGDPHTANWTNISQGHIIPKLPNAVLILLGAAIIASIILNKTIIGRYTFAIGSNMEATKLSGVKVNRWLIIIYMICGAFIGLAAVVLTARLGAAEPDLGLGYELEGIAAVIIGGTSLLGGKGTISGTIIGALIMAVLVNGLRIMSIQQEWQYVVVGVVIVIAVYGDNVRRRRAGDIS